MNIARHDFRPEQYPVTIRFFNTAGETVWERTLQRPGKGKNLVRIPPLADEHGPVGVEFKMGNGEVVRHEPPPGPWGETAC